jgi:hypothetical protein
MYSTVNSSLSRLIMGRRCINNCKPLIIQNLLIAASPKPSLSKTRQYRADQTRQYSIEKYQKPSSHESAFMFLKKLLMDNLHTDNREVTIKLLHQFSQSITRCVFITDALHTPKNLSSRIVFFFMLILTVFLITSYSATIVSLLQTSSNAINTMQDLMKSPLKLSMINTFVNVSLLFLYNLLLMIHENILKVADCQFPYSSFRKQQILK